MNLKLFKLAAGKFILILRLGWFCRDLKSLMLHIHVEEAPVKGTFSRSPSTKGVAKTGIRPLKSTEEEAALCHSSQEQ